MDITEAAAAREPLEQVYDRLLRGEGDEQVLIKIVERRSALAGQAYALEVPHLCDLDLHYLRAALAPVLDEPPLDESGRGLAEQEFVRVQIETIDREVVRRDAFLQQVEDGVLETPARNELTAHLMAFHIEIQGRGELADFYADFQHVVSVIARARSGPLVGALRVAQILREIDVFPSADSETVQIQRWIRTAMALALLTREDGFAGIVCNSDEVTRAEAQRAHRLFYAFDRQDPRYNELNWPLDLSGIEIADAIEAAYKASLEYSREGHPEADLQRYITPAPPEERGRPEPHEQIVPEAQARAEALALGGIPDPVVFAVSPLDRTQIAREIWTQGLPPIPPNQSGHVLRAARADPRVRWGVGSYRWGFLCAVALRPREILHLRDRGRPEDDCTFDDLTRQARSLSGRDSGKYVAVFRELLADAGYRAVQRWDKDGQLIVLDPSCVRVLRETIPPFMQPDRPLRKAPTTVIRAPRAAASSQPAATQVISLASRFAERSEGMRRG
jgi:hypothetical protein